MMDEKQAQRRALILGGLTLALGGGAASLIIMSSDQGGAKDASRTTSEQKAACAVYMDKPACLNPPRPLCDEDLRIARIAWRYFENNYQPATGLYNAADKYPSTTMWDSASALAATIAARELGFIDQKTFDDRIIAMLTTLNTMELFNGEAPNKVYNTMTGKMVDYNNNPTPDGIGVSALDLARMIGWLNILSCMHAKHELAARAAILRWNYCRLIKDGQMFGLMLDPVTKKIQVLQEGRLGYEQYAGKIFQRLGFDQRIAAHYDNKFATKTDIYGVPIAYDSRDPRQLGAYNYVVTESYVMDAMENGVDDGNRALIDNIYEVQKRRWKRTGQVTAVSEDNIDRDPYFVYNTIFVAGTAWSTITDTGVDMDKLRSVSVKAAMSMAYLKPNDPYSGVLYDFVKSAHDPERGWYSGIYEKGLGYNKAITANTNGVILTSILHKMYGELTPRCERCKLGFEIDEGALADPKNQGKCLPGQPVCTPCASPQ
ncbi:MAG: DUF3131 domain-containing protein [Halothiobacillaceae bacterium]|nr:MAG: DUF3131 domain-containing protein [Halothiobacillaceae bacterium]